MLFMAICSAQCRVDNLNTNTDFTETTFNKIINTISYGFTERAQAKDD